MVNLDKNNINFLIDFDSTFIKLESLEAISKISLNNHLDKDKIIEKITSITTQAMDGKISFADALNFRVQLLQANKEHIVQTTKLIEKNISSSFLENIELIKEHSSQYYILSGGFREIIFPIVNKFGISYKNIYANDFVYNDNNIIGVNQSNILSKNLGKAIVANKITGTNFMIGDGYTDYEVKEKKSSKYLITCSFVTSDITFSITNLELLPSKIY